MDALSAKVDAYFVDKKRTGDWRLYIKAAIILFAFAGIYALILFPAMHWAFRLFLCAVLGIGAAMIGFNIMHDAGHKTFSSKKWVNSLFGYSLNLLGGNIFFWMRKHNAIHHTVVNINNHDDDINVGALMRLHPEQPLYPMHRFQAWYALPLYGFGYFYWIYVQDFKKLYSKKIASTEIDIPFKEHIIFYISKLTHISIFVLIPLYFFSFWQVMLGYLVMVLTCGMFISTVFQLAHVVEKTQMIAEPPGEKVGIVPTENAIHQMRTTADFAADNKIVSWIVGGLNFQVEHHLFPRISHVHYPELRKIVMSVSKDLNVEYHEYKKMWDAFCSHLRYAQKMGTAM